MHQPLIIQHLFQVSSLEDVSRERLEAFVEAYPSYGIGHYLLSCKLQAEGSERFMPETQLTCLYFSNPLWLQWLLQNSDGLAAAQPAEAPAAWVAEPVATETQDAAAPVETSYEEESPVETSPAAPEIEEPNVEGTVENVVTMAEEVFVTPESLTSGEVESFAAGEGEDLRAASPTNEEPSAAEQLLRSIEEARELRESLQKLDEEAEPIHDEEAPFVLEEEQPVVVTETAAPEAPEAPQAGPEQPAVEAQAAPEAPNPAPAVTQDFLFEPYHTIDYFASQGIKLTLDENPQDKLGKQLKSFTDWLKTMRRLPQKDREVVPDRVAEEAVQTSAAHSIQGKDVLTETMAEVLAKQGMREKARAVYEKLSLLNPDKRAYFADKIEQLNIS